MSSKQFKTTQDNENTKKTSRDLKIEKKEKSIRERELASLIAFVLFFGGIILGIGIYSIKYYNTYLEEQMIANVEDGYYYLPGHEFVTDDNIDDYMSVVMHSNEYPLSFKLEVLEYLHKQDYENVNEYINVINKLYGTKYVMDDKTDIVVNMNNATLGTINGNLATTQQVIDTVDFLKSEGLLNKDFEISDSSETEGGMTGINAKEAISYSNLAEAEKAYGAKLGLYMYVDALKNYEMINAYIIDNDFMQCVYAINLDGTAVTEESIKNVEDIRTLTVKFSKISKAAELKSVYKNYAILESVKTDYGTIQYCGSDSNIVNLIYVDRSDMRSYVIHSADGIKLDIAKQTMNELFANLEVINEEGR